MERPVRIAINGFGRIGRSVLRILHGARGGTFEVVCLNDIEALETCAYLFRYDSVFGPYPGTVEVAEQALVVDGVPIRFHGVADISQLDLSDVDVVLECTGLGADTIVARRGLEAGARRVLISGPADEAEVTVVIGANDAELRDQTIVSNASCTTNALAPLLRVLDDAFGVETGHMTTVHCYTGSQPTVDKPRGDPARSRAAALSMVPTSTSAARLIDRVLPALAGRIEARAVRVPTASVSLVDLTVQPGRAVDVAEVNRALAAASAAAPRVIGYTEEPLVSMDLRGRPESVIMTGLETQVTGGGLVRVLGWYDNEWGFSNRLLDVAERMARR
ncbi:type I glyceraldehyde-3-phosphate dehydrogenase [Oceanibium sediminis]|uniref:type I glyceraldehyde-3-phosphate dehydrogenase n=1 Tax=Oceanibium sediminis TaxID=2026339 RepID=UPI000DD49508|nr:type I glyceraldehyde-3-phosphate dehydrogenase [Oceanibium sediminis]